MPDWIDDIIDKYEDPATRSRAADNIEVLMQYGFHPDQIEKMAAWHLDKREARQMLTDRDRYIVERARAEGVTYREAAKMFVEEYEEAKRADELEPEEHDPLELRPYPIVP